MAKTLLDGVNEVLKRVGQIDNDTGLLTDLSDSALQSQIDVAVQVWNEVVERFFISMGFSFPQNMDESTQITLAQGQRSYPLPDDLVEIIWPLIDQDESQLIIHYPGGYEHMLIDQMNPDNFTGLPNAAAINPADGELYIDTNPDSGVAGRTYTLRYIKDVSVSDQGDEFPFKDAIFRALVPAVAEQWKWEKHGQFSDKAYTRAVGTAVRLMNPNRQRRSYMGKPMLGDNPTDPLES